jgi:oxalate---CoA ligase
VVACASPRVRRAYSLLMLLGRPLGLLVEPLSGRQWRAEETVHRMNLRLQDYRARGVLPGDRVFIHFGNCNEFFVELLAVWLAGGCAVPIDPGFTPFEIETLAAWAKPRLSVWNGGGDSAAIDVLDRMDIETVDIAEPMPSHPSDRSGGMVGLRLDDDALILFTSGTTGQPKGVVHTHRSLRARWTSLRGALGMDAHRRTLCLLPTHFGHGLICNCLFPWLSGCDLYVLPPFRTELVARLGTVVDEHDITCLSSVPAMWRIARRVARPPSAGSLERVLIGSAPLTAQLWQEVHDWSGATEVVNAYGITETASWLAGTTVSGFTPEDGLVGEAWGGIVRVLAHREAGAPHDPAAVVPTGDSGHVWVNTPALMRGYLDRDDLTSEVVWNGWFATGDIGVIDERGWLYLRGRERDEINRGGIKVYPADVDGVIERFAATIDVCAFGFPEPTLGEEVGVAVVLSSKDPRTVVALYDWASSQLARRQVPRRWYIVDEITRTSRGKVSRQGVAEACRDAAPVNFAALRAQVSPGD